MRLVLHLFHQLRVRLVLQLRHQHQDLLLRRPQVQLRHQHQDLLLRQPQVLQIQTLEERVLTATIQTLTRFLGMVDYKN